MSRMDGKKKHTHTHTQSPYPSRYFIWSKQLRESRLSKLIRRDVSMLTISCMASILYLRTYDFKRRKMSWEYSTGKALAWPVLSHRFCWPWRTPGKSHLSLVLGWCLFVPVLLGVRAASAASVRHPDLQPYPSKTFETSHIPSSSDAREKSHGSGKMRSLRYSTRRATRRSAETTAASRARVTRG